MVRKAQLEEEIAAIKRQLQLICAFVLNRVPRIDEALKAIEMEHALEARTWGNVKDFEKQEVILQQW